MSNLQNIRDPATQAIISEKILKKLEKLDKISENFDKITVALERIATVLESDVHINIDHAHIDQIDHNHVEGKIHTKEDNW